MEIDIEQNPMLATIDRDQKHRFLNLAAEEKIRVLQMRENALTTCFFIMQRNPSTIANFAVKCGELNFDITFI